MNAHHRLDHLTPKPAAPQPNPTTTQHPLPTPLCMELLAAVLSSGAAPDRALLALAHALEDTDDRSRTTAQGLRRLAAQLVSGSHHPADPVPPDEDRLLTAVRTTLVLSARSGLAAAELLLAAAERERLRRSIDARSAIRRLEVLLVIPAGVCLLPAFVLLGVVPVVIALFRT